MGFDERLEGRLREVAGTVSPDVADGLDRVHRMAVERTRSRRRLVVAAALASVVIAVLAGYALTEALLSRDRRPAPVDPDVANPFRVVRTWSAASLGLHHLLDVAPAPDGNVYVTDTSQRVAEVSPRGRVLRSWGGPGAAAGRFRLVTGSLAVGPDGRVYVADTGNFRVQVFSSTGRLLGIRGSFGSGPGQYLWPFDVAVDRRNDLYVADDRATTVTMVSPGGRQVWRRGGDQEPDPRLVGHVHFSGVDGRDRLVLANDDAGLVLRLDATGAVVDVFGSAASGSHELGPHPTAGTFPDGLCDTTGGPGGFSYVSSCQEPDARHHTTWVVGPRHRLVGAWHDNPLAASPRFGPDGRAWSVTFDGDLVRLAVSPGR